MKPLLDTQELARRNNENAAVFAAYERRRKRRMAHRKRRGPLTKLERRLDDLDWQAAEREARPVRAVGFFLPNQPRDRCGACVSSRPIYQNVMPSSTASKSKSASAGGHRRVKRKLADAEIRGRLEQIELATVSALRALQMDVDGHEGTPSATVIKRARAGLR